MSAWAKPGVKCVCVDATGALKQWSTYTIEEIVPEDSDGRLGVLIEGFRAPITWYNEIGAYRLDRFRPLTTKTQEQDVSMFKSLLNKTPINETA